MNTLESSINNSKRVSQGAALSIQNNRYKQSFEGEKSGFSTSGGGGGLLENSRLISEDCISSYQSKTY